MNLRRSALAEALALAYLTSSSVAAAAESAAPAPSVRRPLQLAQAGDTVQPFDISAQPLGAALREFAAAADLRLRYSSGLLRNRRSSAVSGRYAPEEALRVLLAGSGLTYRFANAGTVTLARGLPEESPAQLDRITVEDRQLEDGFKAEFQTSATKGALSLRETPQSVSIITQESLEARQVIDLGQALETAAGVNLYSGTGPFAGMSPFGFNEVTIRGIALDGAFDTREDGFVSPTFFSSPDMTIYERIEVVKGPSSTLYGRGSLGGLVNRVRKKPLPELRIDMELSAGSYDFLRAEGDVTGPIFEWNQARGRLIAAYEDAGSFVDGVESDVYSGRDAGRLRAGGPASLLQRL